MDQWTPRDEREEQRQNEGIQKTSHSWKKNVAYPASQMDDHVRHIQGTQSRGRPQGESGSGRKKRGSRFKVSRILRSGKRKWVFLVQQKKRCKMWVWNCDQSRRHGDVYHNHQNCCAVEGIYGHGRRNYQGQRIDWILHYFFDTTQSGKRQRMHLKKSQRTNGTTGNRNYRHVQEREKTCAVKRVRKRRLQSMFWPLLSAFVTGGPGWTRSCSSIQESGGGAAARSKTEWRKVYEGRRFWNKCELHTSWMNVIWPISSRQEASFSYVIAVMDRIVCRIEDEGRIDDGSQIGGRLAACVCKKIILLWMPSFGFVHACRKTTAGFPSFIWYCRRAKFAEYWNYDIVPCVVQWRPLFGTPAPAIRAQTTPHRTHTRALSRCARSHARCDHTFGSRLDELFVCLKKSLHWSCLCWMFFRPRFRLFFSSFTASLTPSAASPAPLTGIRLNPCATPPWGGPSGPNTGYEPKFCIDVSSEHTPINFPTKNMSFQQEYDVTITAFEDLDLPRHSRASSSCQHTRQQAEVPLCWNWVHWRLASENCRRIMNLLQVGLDMDHVQVFWGLCERGREIETKTLCKHWKTGENSTNSLNEKLKWPCSERNWLSKVYTELRQTWRSNIQKKKKRKYVYIFDEVNQEFESQRLQLQQANQRACQAQRDIICMYGELEMRSRLFRDDRAKDCQENEELRRICCEETDRARQARIDDLS